MVNKWEQFKLIVRRAYQFHDDSSKTSAGLHPFELQEIHEKFPAIVRELFDNGHYSQATFEAYKFIDKKIQRYSNSTDSGVKLMMTAFAETSPKIRLTACQTSSEKDEQKGYQFLFAGSVLAIRNPRGHEYNIEDDPETCLEHLRLASLLVRRLEAAGYT